MSCDPHRVGFGVGSTRISPPFGNFGLADELAVCGLEGKNGADWRETPNIPRHCQRDGRGRICMRVNREYRARTGSCTVRGKVRQYDDILEFTSIQCSEINHQGEC
eukprot:scaffold10199_cov146-Cylindrotheca_fusiformis.AAC.2